VLVSTLVPQVISEMVVFTSWGTASDGDGLRLVDGVLFTGHDGTSEESNGNNGELHFEVWLEVVWFGRWF